MTEVRAGRWAFVTGKQAADIIGVSPGTIWAWTSRGYVQPIRPGAKPAVYRLTDVQRCASERLSKAKRDRLTAGWEQIGLRP